jgi:hypothetical protein
MNVPTLGWSDFARARHPVGGSRTYFDGTDEELLGLVRKHWHQRRPGAGQSELDRVIVVPVPPARFVSGTVLVRDSTVLHANFEKRQPHENGFVRVTAEGEREPARFAGVVLYSAETLLENAGNRSGNWDWEIVCLLAGPQEDEPMHPVTMARNMLAKPGGTPCEYSAQEFAEAIDYWSQRASAHDVTE